MSLVSSQLPYTPSSLLSASNEVDGKNVPDETEATLTSLLGAFANGQKQQPSMERGATEYSQSGLHSPFPTTFTEVPSEESSADHASAAQYTPQQDVRSTNYSTSTTPTSDYGVYPTSARSGSFPEHLRNQYHPASKHSGSSGGMAQPTSPSIPLQDGPTDPPHDGSGQYSPYPPQQQMQHGYPQHAGGAMYTQPRPNWAGYAGHPQYLPDGHPVSGAQTPTSAAPAGRTGQVSHLYCYLKVNFGGIMSVTSTIAPSLSHEFATSKGAMAAEDCNDAFRSAVCRAASIEYHHFLNPWRIANF